MTRSPAVLFAVSLVLPVPALAGPDAGEAEADAFTRAYADSCLSGVSDLEALRAEQDEDDLLRPEVAAPFLGGQEGDAWRLESEAGRFVLALPDGDTFCAVHARRADVEHAHEAFVRLISEAPDPIEAREVSDDTREVPGRGPTRTVSWEWAVPEAPLKQLFTLTLAPADDDGRGQLMGSAALVTTDDD
ncbi:MULTISPECIES: hypothetical protein [unclassified Thioalkalivibrio]|uniref:NMCC_0638 family (lipo)protein n=1 Tax=unclassified Thioalkalivibrio TaxID=2621013 RepID=UPI0003734883|nr:MULTISPECIES: hypothetical protein [unclassified Thioalkalivibrio]PYG03504.1 hypothetical protein D893_00743 [Thioalkalivibrio sp. ALE21]